jgi:hypothetical protein
MPRRCSGTVRDADGSRRCGNLAGADGRCGLHRVDKPAPMTASQVAALIGRRAKWEAVAGVVVDVTITDVRVQYGIVQYQVTPLSGSGTTWLRATSITLEEGQS